MESERITAAVWIIAVDVILNWILHCLNPTATFRTALTPASATSPTAVEHKTNYLSCQALNTKKQEPIFLYWKQGRSCYPMAFSRAYLKYTHIYKCGGETFNFTFYTQQNYGSYPFNTPPDRLFLLCDDNETFCLFSLQHNTSSIFRASHIIDPTMSQLCHLGGGGWANNMILCSTI